MPVLRGAGLQPTGLGEFLEAFLGDTATACHAMIDANQVPPYGVDLVDDHHGSCWRIYHIDAYAKATAKKHRAEAQRAVSSTPAPKRLLPPMLRDVVLH